MQTLTGTFATEHAAKYVAQLCKHFAHKVTASYQDNQGKADLPSGPAELIAHPDRLEVIMQLNSPDQADLARHIIDSHMVRFAHREDFQQMQWE